MLSALHLCVRAVHACGVMVTFLLKLRFYIDRTINVEICSHKRRGEVIISGFFFLGHCCHFHARVRFEIRQEVRFGFDLEDNHFQSINERDWKTKERISGLAMVSLHVIKINDQTTEESQAS